MKTQPTAPQNVENQDGQPLDLGKAVGRIAAMMNQDGRMSTGEMAELRRISADEPFTPALWRTLLALDLNAHPQWMKPATRERRWAVLLMTMTLAPQLHQFEISLGRALADAGWSELRFVQLMRARDTQLAQHLRRVAQYLAGKNQQANWTDIALLLFYQSGEAAENIRLKIARNYYHALYKAEKSN